MQVEKAIEVAKAASEGGTSALIYVLVLLNIAQGVLNGILFRRLSAAWEKIAEKSEKMAAALEISNDLYAKQLAAKGGHQ